MLKTKVIQKRNLKYLLLIMYDVYCSPEFYKYVYDSKIYVNA